MNASLPRPGSIAARAVDVPVRAASSSRRRPVAPAGGTRRADRGSVLIVALLLCAVIGISLVSYIKLTQNSLTLSNRSFYNTASINMAETGVEEALWSFNQVTGGTALATAWNGWDTTDLITAKRTFTDFSLPNNATASVKVYVDHFDPPSGTQPKVIAQATLTIPNSSNTLTKWLELTLRRRSKFAMGMVAKNQIIFHGNTASVDSWNSLYNADGTPRASPVDYSAAVKNSNGSVGSTSVAVGSVAINNADIWGFASVGSSSSSAISVGNNGTIAAYGNAAGTVDTTRIATDFTTNFDTETTPGTGTVITGSFPAVIGTVGVATTYRYNGTITGSFSVLGDVTLILTGNAASPGSDVVRMTGGDMLSIPVGSSLKLYASASMKFTGNGIANANNQASSLQIFGTDTSGAQDIEIGGGASLKGLIYAPASDVTINGDPDVFGSIVANNIDVVGNASFHYDEALANFGGNNPWGVVKWRELTSSTDRGLYTGAMAGW
jgi:hypothetical protein